MTTNLVPKGMKEVLCERGINVTGMKGEEMRRILQNMHDFKYEKTKVEKLLMDHGYGGILFPSSIAN